MDSLITAAARALAAGDPLGALNRVALRDDAPALALRGIAMAQLGDLTRARTLVRKAARAFGPREAVARARCALAEAEIALASRDLNWPANALDTARRHLESHGDHANAAYARFLEARRLLLIGRLDEAELPLAALDTGALPPALAAARSLVVAGIAMRRLQSAVAQAALEQAAHSARQSGIPALLAEVDSALQALNAPVARLIAPGQARLVLLPEVEALMASPSLIVDACRNVVRAGGEELALARRPVLFALARGLAEAWPEDASRDALIARAFRIRHADETHRARLRVEVGRLRALLEPMAEIKATPRGFVLAPRGSSEVAVLDRPGEEAHAAILACLSDGQSWSSSALALALGTSQRSVQRALDQLAEAGKAQWIGHGRARRWVTPPMPGFATSLLLPAALPLD
jgi:hypothetical protein